MGYSRVDCRAGVFALLALFLVPTLWGTLLCSLPCYGTDNQRHENHLHVDCPGVGQVASVRGLPGSRAGCTGLTNTLEETRELGPGAASWARILEQGLALDELAG